MRNRQNTGLALASSVAVIKVKVGYAGGTCLHCVKELRCVSGSVDSHDFT